MENEQFQFVADQLVGNIASFMVDRIRDNAGFKFMPEAQQKEAIDEAKASAVDLVDRAVELIAAADKTVVKVELKKIVSTGKKVTGTIEASSKDEHIAELVGAAGGWVFVTLADAEQFKGGTVPDPEPDQRELGDTA